VVVEKVFSEGAVLSPEVLNVTNADVIRVFQAGCSKVASVGLAIGYPVAPAVPHMIVNGFKNLLNVALVTVSQMLSDGSHSACI
jgi:large subunit ribosomal protein LP0